MTRGRAGTTQAWPASFVTVLSFVAIALLSGCVGADDDPGSGDGGDWLDNDGRECFASVVRGHIAWMDAVEPIMADVRELAYHHQLGHVPRDSALQQHDSIQGRFDDARDDHLDVFFDPVADPCVHPDAQTLHDHVMEAYDGYEAALEDFGTCFEQDPPSSDCEAAEANAAAGDQAVERARAEVDRLRGGA